MHQNNPRSHSKVRGLKLFSTGIRTWHCFQNQSSVPSARSSSSFLGENRGLSRLRKMKRRQRKFFIHDGTTETSWDEAGVLSLDILLEWDSFELEFFGSEIIIVDFNKVIKANQFLLEHSFQYPRAWSRIFAGPSRKTQSYWQVALLLHRFLSLFCNRVLPFKFLNDF